MGNRRKRTNHQTTGQAEPESLFADLPTDDQAARPLESVDWPDLEAIEMPAVDWSFADDFLAWQPEEWNFDFEKWNFDPETWGFDPVDFSFPPKRAAKRRKK